jgi:molybdopterin-guanine dinucleotide biosynthesis protein A
MSASAVVGLVLAGGRSVRFGREKAVALLAGRSLLEWAVRRLHTVTSSVAVSARPGTEAEAAARTLGLAVLHDAPGDASGPLAGVKAGLEWAAQQGATTLAVSPCDAPLLPDDLYLRLLGHAEGGAALAETRDGLQPLCSVWPVDALPAVREALAGGAHPPTWRMLEQLQARRVMFERAEQFANVNTPTDLARIEAHRPR